MINNIIKIIFTLIMLLLLMPLWFMTINGFIYNFAIGLFFGVFALGLSFMFYQSLTDKGI